MSPSLSWWPTDPWALPALELGIDVEMGNFVHLALSGGLCRWRVTGEVGPYHLLPGLTSSLFLPAAFDAIDAIDALENQRTTDNHYAWESR